jgi:hypothetical protein
VGPSAAGLQRDGGAAGGGTTPAAAAAAGAVAALFDDGGVADDTPTGVRAMEAGRSRFAFNQQQQQQQGNQQGNNRLSGGGGGLRGGVGKESSVPEAGRRGAVRMPSSTSHSPGAGTAAAAAGVGRGSLGSRSQSFGKDVATDGGGSVSGIGVDPTWWGSR